MFLRTSFIGVAIVLMSSCTQTAEAPQALATEPQAAADHALTVFQKLVNPGNFKTLGLDSIDEAKQAKLGTPLEIFNIGLEKLRGYKAGDDSEALLTKSSETVYPLLVNGQVKSSVTVLHKESGYQPSSFGNADVVKRLVAAEKSESGTSFIVRVPALNMFFLGGHTDGKLVLTPIIDDSRLELRGGETLPADLVLVRLVPIASAYNGEPM
jgi:hypothetical protein